MFKRANKLPFVASPPKSPFGPFAFVTLPRAMMNHAKGLTEGPTMWQRLKPLAINCCYLANFIFWVVFYSWFICYILNLAGSVKMSTVIICVMLIITLLNLPTILSALLIGSVYLVIIVSIVWSGAFLSAYVVTSFNMTLAEPVAEALIQIITLGGMLQ